jgi:hydrogenase nickel incorporation protein HypA/HybF
MHEVGLMESMLEIALEHARDRGADRIHAIALRVGRLAGVEAEALGLAFEVVTTGTPAEGARLDVEAVPVACYCRPCAREFEPEGFVFACPRCGALSADVRRGRELELASLEVS